MVNKDTKLQQAFLIIIITIFELFAETNRISKFMKTYERSTFAEMIQNGWKICIIFLLYF